MRYEIEGFDDYEIDDEGQVYRKPSVWNVGRSVRARDEVKMKPSPTGCYTLRRNGVQKKLSKDQLLALKK